MNSHYQLIGAELSPYSIKVRSYLRFKKIPHKWRIRNSKSAADFKQYARLPIVPLLITPAGEGWQDSTPIIEQLEAMFTEVPAQPADSALAFLSELLEEYADEWGNKHMFHFRWKAEADQNSASLRLAEMQMPLFLRYIPIVNSIISARIATMIKTRMSQRAWVIGSNENTQARIEASFSNLLSLLEQHLQDRKYLFGDRPCYADFALWGQIYNAWTDPTGSAMIDKEYSGLRPWLNRMQNPKVAGDFEHIDSLLPTLLPLLKTELAERFLPWTDAVTRAMHDEQDSLTVEMNGSPFVHSIGGPQKYHVKSLKVLREKYQRVGANQELDSILSSTGCKPFLQLTPPN